MSKQDITTAEAIDHIKAAIENTRPLYDSAQRVAALSSSLEPGGLDGALELAEEYSDLVRRSEYQAGKVWPWLEVERPAVIAAVRACVAEALEDMEA